MTTEERADRMFALLELDKGDPLDTQWCRDQIAAAIRDAVAEAEATTKQAIQRATAYAEEIGKANLECLQARAALEPFARLACAYDGWNSEGGTIIAIGQLRAARDAYLALGGKLE